MVLRLSRLRRVVSTRLLGSRWGHQCLHNVSCAKFLNWAGGSFGLVFLFAADILNV